MGFGTSARGSCMSSTNGISTGVGLPMLSVRMPIWLWKYDVVRMPPLNQVEYGAPVRITAPGLPSAARRVWIAAPTVSMPSGIERIEVVVERIAERRREQHRARRARSGDGCT